MQLANLVSRLVAQPLDRTRPLWEIWLIDGVAGGNLALLSKVHHCAIDGAAGNELLVSLLDLTAEVAEHEPDDSRVPDRIPSSAELLSYPPPSLARHPPPAPTAVPPNDPARPTRPPT